MATATASTIETMKQGTQFKVKSGKVYVVASNPYLTTANTVRFYAYQVGSDGAAFGPCRSFYGKSVVEIL